MILLTRQVQVFLTNIKIVDICVIMLSKKYEFESKLWKWSGGKSSWYFLSLPQTESIDIKTNYPFAKRGFGSIPVAVIINDQIWTTSIFPDSSNNRYILPVKKNIRNLVGIDENDMVKFLIKIDF